MTLSGHGCPGSRRRHTGAVGLDSRGRRSVALLVALAVSCGLAFWLLYVVTVRTSYGRLFADASLRGAVRTRSGLGDLVDHALGVVTVASLLAAVALVAVIALLRLRRGLGLAALVVLVGANASAQLLKELLLQRPDLGLLESAPSTLNSLPSGHSTAAFSVVVALLVVAPPRTREALAATGAAYACVVALATMAAGWHRASDSAAAFLLVGVWVGLALAVLVLAGGAEDAPAEPAPASPRRRSLAVAATLAIVVAVSLMALLALVGPVRETGFGRAAAFATGAVLIVATAAALQLAILALLERVAPSAPAVRSDDVVG